MKTEAERVAAWHEQSDAAAALVPSSAYRARFLAWQIVNALLVQLVDAEGVAELRIALGAAYVERMAAVVLLSARLSRVLESDPETWTGGALVELRHEADRLAARLFGLVGPRGSWPDELRVPYEAAETLRRACEADVRSVLPVLYLHARGTLERLRLNPTVLDELLVEAHREDSAAGLRAIVTDAVTEQRHACPVLHALHVACAAAAIGFASPHPPACACPDCDRPTKEDAHA